MFGHRWETIQKCWNLQMCLIIIGKWSKTGRLSPEITEKRCLGSIKKPTDMCVIIGKPTNIKHESLIGHHWKPDRYAWPFLVNRFILLRFQTYLIHLAHPMGSAERLDIIVRVPIGIVDNDRIRRGQVDAQPPRASRQQENKIGRVGGVESLNPPLPLCTRDRPV